MRVNVDNLVTLIHRWFLFFWGVENVPEESQARLFAINRCFDAVVHNNIVEDLQDFKQDIVQEKMVAPLKEILSIYHALEEIAKEVQASSEEYRRAYRELKSQSKHVLANVQVLESDAQALQQTGETQAEIITLYEQKVAEIRTLLEMMRQTQHSAQQSSEGEIVVDLLSPFLGPQKSRIESLLDAFPSLREFPEAARSYSVASDSDTGASTSQTVAEVVKKDSNSSQASSLSQQSENYLQEQSEIISNYLQEKLGVADREQVAANLIKYVYKSGSVSDVVGLESFVSVGADQISCRLVERDSMTAITKLMAASERVLAEKALALEVRADSAKLLYGASNVVAEQFPGCVLPRLTAGDNGTLVLEQIRYNSEAGLQVGKVVETFSQDQFSQVGVAFFKTVFEYAAKSVKHF